jgi:hypothetical protein
MFNDNQNNGDIQNTFDTLSPKNGDYLKIALINPIIKTRKGITDDG